MDDVLIGALPEQREDVHDGGDEPEGPLYQRYHPLHRVLALPELHRVLDLVEGVRDQEIRDEVLNHNDLPPRQLLMIVIVLVLHKHLAHFLKVIEVRKQRILELLTILHKLRPAILLLFIELSVRRLIAAVAIGVVLLLLHLHHLHINAFLHDGRIELQREVRRYLPILAAR